MKSAKEKAIEHLENNKIHRLYLDKFISEALDIAIKETKREERAKCKTCKYKLECETQ